MRCRVCGNESGNTDYDVKEMLFGFRDVFRYFQCSQCECLQIAEVPADLGKYYPENYYSYALNHRISGIRKRLLELRDKYAVFGIGLIGNILYRKYPKSDLQSLRLISADRESRILDVGCGAGKLLNSLRNLGMKNLLGVDPFVSQDIEYENGLKIQKGEISDIKETWDIVMFHHSFEHIPNPNETLGVVAKLLPQHGNCIIRVPTVSSYAWKNYGVDWVQLDAPRHLFLHSLKSMSILADNAGLELWHVAYDSTEFQFTGSERYKKGQSLLGEDATSSDSNSALFTKKQIREFSRRAKALNRDRLGDQAIFYLRKK